MVHDFITTSVYDFSLSQSRSRRSQSAKTAVLVPIEIRIGFPSVIIRIELKISWNGSQTFKRSRLEGSGAPARAPISK